MSALFGPYLGGQQTRREGGELPCGRLWAKVYHRTDVYCPCSCNYNTPNNFFEPLAELSFLRWIDLGGVSRLTDAGVQPLANCRDLEYLNLNGTQVTDRGIAFVAQMPELESLLVADTQVTDATLDLLANHRKLTSVNVLNTQVTEAGVARFRRQHPGCHVASGKQ